jgi:hypothetical protein
MLKATTILELYEALSPQEQEKCRSVITAAPVTASPSKTKAQRPQLRPEHRTDALVRDMVVRDLSIKFTTPIRKLKIAC